MSERIPVEERVRRQRWVGAGLVTGAVLVGFILWVLRARAGTSGTVEAALAGAGGLVVSGLVLGGLVLLARTDPRWTDRQVVATYAIAGFVVWGLAAFGLGRGTTGQLGEGVLIAALWPAWLLALFFANVAGLAGVVP
jgi:FtsH-binding integral membrane protein